MKNQFYENDNYLTIKEVCARVRYSRQHIYLLMSKGLFPKPIRFGKGRVVWSERLINQWISDRINNFQSNYGVPNDYNH